jgi:hypothetical protein
VLTYVEYVVHLIHRESWQSALSIYESRAEVTSFCLELSKKLDMRYESPSVRVDLMAAPTGEMNHVAKQRLSTGKTTMRSNLDIGHNSHDDISVPASTNTIKFMSKEIESNVYHDLTMMYATSDDTITGAAATSTNHTTSSLVGDFVVDHQQFGGSKSL